MSKTKKLLGYFVVLVSGLIIGSAVFGATTYERQGTTVNFSFDNWSTFKPAEAPCSCGFSCWRDPARWQIGVENTLGEWFFSDTYASTTNSVVKVFELPMGSYQYVMIRFRDQGDGWACGDYTIGDYYALEGTKDSGVPVFNISSLGFKILTLDDESLISGAMAYVGQLFNDNKPIMILWLGLVIGFYVVDSAIGLFRKKRSE
jgi:hypothetical protein